MVEQIEDKKKGWVVPITAVEALRDEEAELFKEAFLAMHDYNINGSIDTIKLSPAARVLFNAFKSAMDANTKRYEERCKRNQENGKKNKGKKKNDTQNNPK